MVEKTYFLAEDHEVVHNGRYQKWIILLSLFIVLLVIAVVILSVVVSTVEDDRPAPQKLTQSDTNGVPWPKPSLSALAKFTRAVVASDNGLCAEIGRAMLVRGGNAVDAIIATNICQGALNAQSSGIGGGFFFTFYDSKRRKCTTIDAREAAPEAANQLKSGDVNRGPKAIGVPGEVSGMWYAHNLFGKLSWRELFTPTIKYLREGFPVSGAFANVLNSNWVVPYVLAENNLDVFINNKTGKLYQQGEILKRPILANTLQDLADAADPVRQFYEIMGLEMATEIGADGGLLTASDFQRYHARVEENPVQMEIPGTGMIFCGPKPPSSAVVIAAWLNIVSGMNISPSNLTNVQSASDMYNNMVEAMKFVYAARSYLGDPIFVPNVNQTVSNITSPDWAALVRSRIPEKAQPAYWYGGDFLFDDKGTTHMSAIDADGNAAAITASVNWYFGSKQRSKKYGIVYNNQLADFSFPDTSDDFGLAPTDENLIAPGKRPLSSMSPVIIYEYATGKPHLVLGAAGGSRIISVVGYVASRVLWLNETIKQAIDAPRFHNQLTPNETNYEHFMPQFVLLKPNTSPALKRIRVLVDQVYADHLRDDHGQTIDKDNPREISVVCGLHSGHDGLLYANSDFRKPGGYPAGY